MSVQFLSWNHSVINFASSNNGYLWNLKQNSSQTRCFEIKGRRVSELSVLVYSIKLRKLTSVKQIQFLRWIATGFYYQIKRYNACLKGNFNKVCIFTRIVAVIFIRYQKFHDLKTLFDHTHFKYSKNSDVSNFSLVFYNVFKFHSCIYLEQRQSLLGIMKISDLDTKLLLFINYTPCVIDKSTVIHAHSRQSWEIKINYNITRVILLNSKVEVSADFELLIIASRAVNKSCRLYTKKIYI